MPPATPRRQAHARHRPCIARADADDMHLCPPRPGSAVPRGAADHAPCILCRRCWPAPPWPSCRRRRRAPRYSPKLGLACCLPVAADGCCCVAERRCSAGEALRCADCRLSSVCSPPQPSVLSRWRRFAGKRRPCRDRCAWAYHAGPAVRSSSSRSCTSPASAAESGLPIAERGDPLALSALAGGQRPSLWGRIAPMPLTSD